MQQDLIAEQIEQVKTFCFQHGVTIVYGIIVKNPSPTIRLVQLYDKRLFGTVDEFKAYHNDKLTNFLEALKTSRASIVTFTPKVYDFAEDEEELNGKGEALTAAERMKFEILQRNHNNLHEFWLQFFVDGVCYAYDCDADWMFEAGIYMEEDLDSGNDEEDEDDDDDDDDDNDSNEDEIPNLTKEELDSIVKTVFEDEEFKNETDPHKRRKIAVGLAYLEAMPRFQVYGVASLAEKLYQSEIQPKIDEETLQKIAELRKANPKITKTEVAARLGFRRIEQLNKFWYKE